MIILYVGNYLIVQWVRIFLLSGGSLIFLLGVAFCSFLQTSPQMPSLNSLVVNCFVIVFNRNTCLNISSLSLK